MFDSFENPQTVVQQAPLFMGFPRQEYWSGLPFPSSGGSSQPRDQMSPALAGGFFTTEPPGKPNIYDSLCCTLETNTVLYINYISIKFFKNRKVSLCISSVPVCVCVDRQGQVSKISAAARCGDQKHWTKRQESWYFSQVIALAKLFSFSKSVSSKGK